MTIDERLEFLAKSIESHDDQIGRLTDDISKLTNENVKLSQKLDRLADSTASLLSAQVETGAQIRQLTSLVFRHEQRIAGLEGGPA